jgi:signal transduction histidine kinase
MKTTNASRRVVADGLLAGSLAVVGAIGLLTAMGSRLPDGAESPNALAALLVAGQSLPIAWRRRTPLLVMAVVEVATVAYFLLHFPPTGAALGVLVAYYTVAARHPTRVMLPFAGGLAAAVLILTAQGRMSFQVFALLQVLFAAAWLMGAEQRTRREYTALVEDRAARLERELGYLAREAVADERVRITRELHETVADNVRAMAAQAKSAERSLPAAAAASRDTIGLIERTAERTLSDLRRGLEVLDPADPVVAQRGSLPTMSQLSALVTEVKMAGLPVDLKVEGDAVPLPAEVDGSAYRIVQEALTSCLKRPGTARPLVVIRYGEEDLELQVTDAREGGAWQVDPGRGRYEDLGWMQPRPTDQEAGPEAWPEGSYGVLARLPLAPVRP